MTFHRFLLGYITVDDFNVPLASRNKYDRVMKHFNLILFYQKWYGQSATSPPIMTQDKTKAPKRKKVDHL